MASRALALASLCGLGGCFYLDLFKRDRGTGLHDTGDRTSCFTAGTPVDTPDGPRPIEALSVGDPVWAWDVENHRPVVREVTALHHRSVDQLVRLDVGGQVIETTAEHPFFSLSDDAWVEAGELVPGEALAVRSAEGLVPLALEGVEIADDTAEVYNLTVGGGPEHDYFAGGVLVHNKTWVGDPDEYGGSFYLTLTLVWTDVDGAVPSDTNADGVLDLGCSSDTLDLVIEDPLYVDDWDFGMVEAGGNGWSGEDCLNGYAGYSLCHAIHLQHHLVEVCTPGEIVEGATTLFDHGKDPFLTYMIDDMGDCFVTGNDVPYYDALGCTLLQ